MKREIIAMISREVHKVCYFNGCNLGCKYRHLKPDCVNYAIADCMLSQGVLAPPCKVGDTVWKIEDVWHLDDEETRKYHYEKEAVEFMIRSISISCNSKGVWTKKIRICQVQNGKTIDHQHNIEFDDFGKTIFLSKEEAIKALKTEENVNG